MDYLDQSPRGERSLGELFRELGLELSTLVRQEAALARAEMSQKLSQVGKNVGMIAAGGAIAYAGFLGLCAAVTFLLVEGGLAWWAASLLVGVAVGLAGGVLIWKGLEALKETDLVPRQTLETLKEERNEPRIRRAA